MASTIRPRAWMKNDVANVKALISHPMETGMRKNKATGDKIPAHFIQDLIITHKGEEVLHGYLGPAVSKNPFLNFKFKGAAKGDKLTIKWSDNKGNSDSLEVSIS